jgi:pimeloyl-ACP methyl ester carboxylesterase
MTAPQKEDQMQRVRSMDGTSIAYERSGQGPAVILVSGGLDDGSELRPLAAELARDFTVYRYAKRGTGDSGDTLPYAMEREIEDIEALVGEAGGSAHLYGVSGGGALALEAAAAGVVVDRVAVYEVPYNVADDAADRQRAYFGELEALLAEGRRGEALELFMRTAGSSAADIAGARNSPWWPGLLDLAHTLARGCGSFGPPPAVRLETIRRPALIATGGPDPHMRGLPADFFESAADAIAASIPRAERVRLEDQTHVPDAGVLAPVLQRFFSGAPAGDSLPRGG